MSRRFRIPPEIEAALGLEADDAFSVTVEGDAIGLCSIPDSVERYPDIDAAIAEGLADLCAGRESPAFEDVDELLA